MNIVVVPEGGRTGSHGESGKAPLPWWWFAGTAALLAALWMATRPYGGIVGDARLYTVQALSHLRPGRFASDLYLRYGSQDRFTIFSLVYEPFIRWLGVSRAAMVLTVAGQGLWGAGLLYLLRSILADYRQVFLSAALVLAMPAQYGAIFFYGGAELTPRLYAEAAALVGLGLLLRQRLLAALVVLALAAAIHPLMSLPAIALVFVYRGMRHPGWWIAAAGGVILLLGLAVAGIPPFSHLLLTFDPEWLQLALQRDTQCFVTKWLFTDYSRIIATVLASCLAIVFAQPEERRLILASLIVGLGGVLLALIGGDWLHDVLIVDLQPWRAMWLPTLLAYGFLAPTFIRIAGGGRRPVRLTVEMLAFSVVLLLLTRFFPLTIFYAASALGGTCLVGFVELGAGVQVRRAGRVAVRIFILAIALMAARWIWAVAALLPRLLETVWPFLLSLMLVPLGLAAIAILYAGGSYDRPLVKGLRWLPLVLLPLALLGWDRRSPWEHFIESSAPAPASLATLLPESASVYWDGGGEMLWLRLQRPSYFFCAQGAGSLFFRQTAVEFARRAGSLRPLRGIDFRPFPSLCPAPAPGPAVAPSAGDLRRACLANPDLDILMLTHRVPDVPAQEWRSPAVLHDVRIDRGQVTTRDIRSFYVYRCAGFR